jgi:uncharacterized alpha/beta hydrolase family protein
MGNKNNKKEVKKSNVGSLLKTLLGIIIFFAFLFALILFVEPDTYPSDAPKSKTTKTSSKQDKIKTQFSGWDGSHIKLTKLIRKSMNDPGSYEHVETLYFEFDDIIVVTTKFRGKNMFGGVVLQQVSAEVTIDGEIVKVFE